MAAPTKGKSQVSMARLDERISGLDSRVEIYQVQNAEAHSRQEKIFDKFAESMDKLSSRMDVYNAHLETHIRRTDAAEGRLELQEKQAKDLVIRVSEHAQVIARWQSRASFAAKICIVLAGLAAAAAAVVQVIEFVTRHK